jgi:hypothetical protein
MKMREAEDIISGKADRTGYIVSFEVRERSLLRSDHFPDVRAGEPGIQTPEAAWKLAEAFAAKRTANRDIVNIRLCYAADFTPVGPELLNKYPEDRR